MVAELVIFVVIVSPLAFLLWSIDRRFAGCDEEIMELKTRINKLENEVKKLKK